MDYAFSFLDNEDPNSVLTNFVVRNSFLAALIIDASPTMSNLTIVDNRFGIEAYAGAQPDITNCIFYNNTNGDLSGCEAQYSLVQDSTTDGLIAHWKFDEGTGTTAYDSAGTNHGTIYGATWTTGVLNGALDFDGSDDDVTVPSDDSLEISGDLTIALWMNASTDITPPIGYISLLNKHQGGSTGLGYVLQFDHSGTLRFVIGTGTQSYVGLGETNTWTGNTWYHVVVTYNPEAGLDNVKFFVDGQIDGSADVSVLIGTHAGPLYIASEIGTRQFFPGVIDDVRLYGRALSAAEVRQVYRQGFGPRFVDPCSGDYHLKSEGWSWSRSGWTWDDVTSWCIDSGNPGTPLRDEPESVPRDPDNIYGVNVRVNMGVYGGTSQASMPPHGWALLADLNNDGIVNWLDVGLYAGCWLSTDYEPAGDLNRDGIVNMADWALLLTDWQQETTW
jgi:parallel beta-helix repeat protein